MKKIISFMAVLMLISPVVAAVPAGQSRRAMAQQMGAERATASRKYIETVAQVNKPSVKYEDNNAKVPVADKNDDVTVVPPVQDDEDKKDMREKERTACIQNNIGVGATFVWASRYSNTGNYASMVEDVENPENNVCWVKVEVKSSDPKISVADVPAKYFVMGQGITCGDWANEDTLRQRILDAKKNVRTWGTIGGVVGGAGVGVGAMELFGNKLIGGKVMGQKNENLSENELLRSQILALKKDNSARYNEIKAELQALKQACEEVEKAGADKPEGCTKYDYEYLLRDMK